MQTYKSKYLEIMTDNHVSLSFLNIKKPAQWQVLKYK